MKDIDIQHFSVNNLSKASGIFSGTNVQSNFSSSNRLNEGFGSVNGEHNTLTQNQHVVTKRPQDDE